MSTKLLSRQRRPNPSVKRGLACRDRSALKRIVFVLAVAAGASLPITPVMAQDDGSDAGVFKSPILEMKVRAGFGKLEISNWMGSWVPFRVTVTNQGPPIIGRLIVHCESSPNPTPQVREYVKEVQLPSGSSQLHEIAAYLNSSQAPVVRLESEGRVVAETSVRVERTYGLSDQLEIAVIDTDSTALNNISSTEVARAPNRAPFKSAASGAMAPALDPALALQPAPLPGQPRRRAGGPAGSRPVFLVHPTVLAPEDLPREFITFDQLDAVVIGDAPLNQLSSEQANALRLWVGAGGLLIITGAADLAGLEANGLASICPVEVLGTSSATSLVELNEVYGSFDSADRLSFLQARVKPDARVLVGSQYAALVAEKSYGSGLVRFLAINPKLNPYRAWIASKDLWADLLLPAAEPKPRHPNWITSGRRSSGSSNRWGVQGFLFHLADIAPPSPGYVLLFLLAYVLALGPINYAILRWKRKTDLAWATIPAVVVLFALVSAVVAQLGRGSSSVAAVASLVEVHQRDRLSVATSGLLLMPAAKRTQELTLEGPNAYASDVNNGNQSSSVSATGVIECERTPGRFLMRVPMTTWTSGLFQLRSISEDSPPLISAEAAGLEVAIRNLSDSKIDRAVYISPAGVSELFDLEANGERRITLSAPQASSFNSWYVAAVGQGTEEEELFQELSTILDREAGGDPALTQNFFEGQLMSESIGKLRAPLLIGFVDREAAITLQGPLKRKGKALYVIHL